MMMELYKSTEMRGNDMANAYEDAIETCRELGTKAAKARYQHDEATCRFHTDYMRRFIAARPDFKTELRSAFDQAYKDESQAHFEHIKPTIRW